MKLLLSLTLLNVVFLCGCWMCPTPEAGPPVGCPEVCLETLDPDDEWWVSLND